jgi:outer membrane receptor protein involved in Fe transport
MTNSFRPVLALMLASAAMPLHAEEAAMDAAAADAVDTGESNEIVVTGLKFDRTLQDTPESVKVFTSDDIERQSLTNIFDLIDRTANLASTFNESGFTIRGISNTNVSGTGFGDLATVYLDGSPLPSDATASGPLDLWDIDQVEILRGPQSTLQGRNALAGAIIIKTADPSFDWRGKARAMITDANGEYRFGAAVGGPIIDDVLAFRVAGELTRGDGFVKNSFTGGHYDPNSSDVVRAKLLFTPSGADGLQIKLSYLYDRHDGNGRGYAYSDTPDYWSNRIVEANRPTFSRSKTDLFTLDATLPLGDVFTLSSISTYNHLRTSSAYDGDLQAVDTAYGDAVTNQKIFSQELRLTFDTGPLQGLIGGYYSRTKNPDSNTNSTFGLDPDRDLGLTPTVAAVLQGPPFGLDPATALFLAQQARAQYPGLIYITSSQDYSIDIETMALFGDASFEITPGLKLLAGFRYDREKQRVSNDNIVVINTPLPNPALYPAPLNMILSTVNGLIQQQADDASSSSPLSNTSYEAFLPKGGISWEIAPDKTISAIVQRGYRSGGSGVNPARASTYVYDPEYTWNYELSLRTQWLDRRLTFNANAFFIDWTDQQVSVQLSNSVYDYETQNAGKSRVYGFEVESDFDVTDSLNIYGSVGYARTEFLEFDATGGFVDDLSGLEFVSSPRWTWAAGFSWRDRSGISVNANVNHRGAAYQGLIDQSARDVPGRTLVNAKVGWNNDNFGAYLFANNIFDEKFFDYQYDNDGRLNALLGEPSMIGLSFEARF